MQNPTEKEITHRAYQLWEQAGRPEGRDKEFYHQAEQELRNEDKSSPLRTPESHTEGDGERQGRRVQNRQGIEAFARRD